MDRKDIIERELNLLPKIVSSHMERVQTIVSELRKEKIKLWLTKADQYKLLTLGVWEKKYKVPLRFIIFQLLPFWEEFVQRRSRKMKKAGLNVRVSTLIGKKSEKVLQDIINKTYPDRENVDYWISLRREEILRTRLNRQSKSDGVHSKDDASDLNTPKTLINFSTPAQYLKYYKKQLKLEQQLRNGIEKELKKYTFIDNPFRPEYLNQVSQVKGEEL